jgi:4-hydroxyphenylpyruvate dioxygenase-like putative hemolysin
MNDALPLDHIALRVLDREAALPALTRVGYEIVDRFVIPLEDGSLANSCALKKPGQPEIFISDGPPGSKIHQWVTNRKGPGAVHHLAYATVNVQRTMDEWSAQGVKFLSPRPLICPCNIPLILVFTEEDPTTGLIYELITRNGHPGFCLHNVKRLMDSSSE